MPQSRWHDPGPRSRHRHDAESYPSPRGQTRRPPPARRAPRRGPLTGRLGVSLIAGAAALGVAVTVAIGSEPGNLLGAFVLAGTLAASLTVQPQAVYLLIPVPALAYLAAVAGLAGAQAAGGSRTALAASAAQWAASGFPTMAAATAAAIAVTVARRLRRDDSGTPGLRRSPPAAGRGGRHGGSRGQGTGSRPSRDAGYPVSGFAATRD